MTITTRQDATAKTEPKIGPGLAIQALIPFWEMTDKHFCRSFTYTGYVFSTEHVPTTDLSDPRNNCPAQDSRNHPD